MDRPWRDAETLRKLYHEKELSLTDIADRFDVHPSTIHYWMQRHGIETRERIEAVRLAMESDDPWADADLLYELYVEKGLTQTEIADRLGCSNYTVSKWLNRHGITRPWRDPDTLKALYVDRGLNQQEVACHLDCTRQTVARWLQDHGIDD